MYPKNLRRRKFSFLNDAISLLAENQKDFMTSDFSAGFCSAQKSGQLNGFWH